MQNMNFPLRDAHEPQIREPQTREPRRLSDPRIAEFLSPEACRELFKKIVSMTTGGGQTIVSLTVRSSGLSKWVRSQMQVSAETNEVHLSMWRIIRGARGKGSTLTNRLDDAGLREAVRHAENTIRESAETPNNDDFDFVADPPMSNPKLWDEATYNTSAQRRSEIARSIMEPAETKGLISAGKVEIAAEGKAYMHTNGKFLYYPVTDVQCSATVRSKRGTASGWAGQHHHAIDKVDFTTVGARSLEKCLRSENPVAAEPGRYTVVLEPQAVADLFSPLLERHDQESEQFMRQAAEAGEGPFAGRRGYSKIGQQVFDKRFTLRADPMDPEAGFIPFSHWGGIYKAVNWIHRGILRDLSYADSYALEQMGLPNGLPNSFSYNLSAEGPTMSVDEMIRSTQRGILVTRFSNVRTVHAGSMLLGGYTRDGLWLIENGKISKSIKNFRFTESPMFVLNKVEAVSTPVRVFMPPYARIVPAIKANDFSFTALADAV
jgi:predicted Zn-dependent protease